MSRIQKVSTYLIWVFNVLLVTIPTLCIGLWTWWLQAEPFIKNLYAGGLTWSKTLMLSDGTIITKALNLTPLATSIGVLGSLIGSLPLWLGIWTLRGLFQNYRNDNIFSLENVQKYKRLGQLCFFSALLAHPIQEALETVGLTMCNPPGQRSMNISFGTFNLETVFVGTLILVISWVMAEAYKLQEDKNLTI